jgi:hypothetical protein
METPHAVINFGVGYGLPTYLPFIKGIYAG